jgi:hypothetical protein
LISRPCRSPLNASGRIAKRISITALIPHCRIPLGDWQRTP